MTNSSRARSNGQKVLDEIDESLSKMFGNNSDDRYAARAVVLNPKQALERMMAMAASLEAEATRTLDKQRQDLLQAGSSSVSGMQAERDATFAVIALELHSIETDREFSINALCEAIEARDATIEEQHEKIKEHRSTIAARDVQLHRLVGELKKAREEAEQQMQAAAEAQSALLQQLATLEAAGFDSAAAAAEMAARHEEQLALLQAAGFEDAATAAAAAAKHKEQVALLKKAGFESAAAAAQAAEAHKFELEKTHDKMAELESDKLVRERRLRDEQSALKGSRDTQVKEAREREMQMTKEREKQVRSIEREKKKLEAEKDKEAAMLKLKLSKMQRMAATALDGSSAPGGDVRARQLLYSLRQGQGDRE